MLSEFCLRLACGISLALILVSFEPVTSGFFRVQLLVILGLTVLAGLALPTEASGATLRIGLVVVAAVASFVGSIAWLLERRRAGQVMIAVVALATAPATLFGGPTMAGSWQESVLGWIDPMAAAVVLGSTLTAMLLGHWYLVTPTMALAPLRRLVGLMAASLVVRALLAALGTLLVVYGSSTASFPALGSSIWVWATLRWLGGIVGAGLVAWLSWQTLAIRSTQSATGILYVGVILVFLGELAAQVLSQRFGVPL